MRSKKLLNLQNFLFCGFLIGKSSIAMASRGQESVVIIKNAVLSRDYAYALANAANLLKSKDVDINFRKISSCFNFLLTIIYYDDKSASYRDSVKFLQYIEDYKKLDGSTCSDLQDQILKYCKIQNNTMCLQEEAPAIRSLFNLLIEDARCESSRNRAIRNIEKLASERRAELRRAKPVDIALWSAAGASLAGAVILGLTSALPSNCASDTSLPSDGKDINCVYPYNYKIGVPILAAGGIAFTVAAAIKTTRASNERQNTDRQLQQFDIVKEGLESAECPQPLPEPVDATGAGRQGQQR